jgi:hypothetical protein
MMKVTVQLAQLVEAAVFENVRHLEVSENSTLTIRAAGPDNSETDNNFGPRMWIGYRMERVEDVMNERLARAIDAVPAGALSG